MAETTSNEFSNPLALDYDIIVVVNFGSQKGPAIARHIRAGHVYCEIWPATVAPAEFARRGVKGIVVTTGHAPEDRERAQLYVQHMSDLDIPVLMFSDEVKADKAGDLPADLQRFSIDTCGCEPNWTMANFIDSAVKHIRRQVGEDAVVCGLSGGVDSSVAAALVYRAIGDQLTTIFVDHGLLRKGEAEQVTETFTDRFGPGFVKVDAGQRFLDALAGVSDPEAKRKIIGNEFIRIFEEKAREVGRVRHLVQGTLYTDVIESGGGGTTVIKSHHNVGGLPDDMDLQLLEPLSSLFKDEVRSLGDELGLPHEIVWRQPFPGPGLAIRVMGAVDAEKLAIERECDAILIEEIAKNSLEDEVWQYFTVLLNTRTVGMLNGQRTYGHVVAIRAVTSQDGTAAGWARLPHDVLDRIANRMMHEVPGVSRVVYDISSKPPATIEWE